MRGLSQNSVSVISWIELLLREETLGSCDVICGSNGLFYSRLDLNQRHDSLDRTKPSLFFLRGRRLEVKSWGELLCQVSDTLLDLYPSFLSKIWGFNCRWTNRLFFKQSVANTKEIRPGIYIRRNLSATHSVIVLQALLDYFGVAKSDAVLMIKGRQGALELKELEKFCAKQSSHSDILLISKRRI